MAWAPPAATRSSSRRRSPRSLSAVYLLWQPQPLDLAAQTFRADLWERDGWVVWNDAWYGGHTVPGYSLLYPPLGAWLGPGAARRALRRSPRRRCSRPIAARAYGERAWLGAAWFGLASTVALYGGRIDVRARAGPRPRRRSSRSSAIGVALGGPAGRRGAASRARSPGCSPRSPPPPSCSLGSAVAPGAAAPSPRPPGRGDDGRHAGPRAGVPDRRISSRSPPSSFLWIPLVCRARRAGSCPSGRRTLRCGIVLYAAARRRRRSSWTRRSAATRSGSARRSPGRCWRSRSARRRPSSSLLRRGCRCSGGSGRRRSATWPRPRAIPSTEAAYYEPLVERARAADRRRADPGRDPADPQPLGGRLRRRALPARPRLAAPARVRRLRPVHRRRPRPPAPTASGCVEHGVAYVAAPDAAPDYLAADEVDLLERGGLAYLREVWADDDWRLFEVRAFDGSRGPAARPWPAAAPWSPSSARTASPSRCPAPASTCSTCASRPYFEIEAGSALRGERRRRRHAPHGRAATARRRSRSRRRFGSTACCAASSGLLVGSRVPRPALGHDGAMPEVMVGPMLRYVGETDATVWVETDEPCEVEILGRDAAHVHGRGPPLRARRARGPRAERPASLRGPPRRRSALAARGLRVPAAAHPADSRATGPAACSSAPAGPRLRTARRTRSSAGGTRRARGSTRCTPSRCGCCASPRRCGPTR